MITAKRKTGAMLSAVLVVLILCDAASLVVLFGRLSTYSSSYVKNVIPLTQSNEHTVVTQTTRSQWMNTTKKTTENNVTAKPSTNTQNEKTVQTKELSSSINILSEPSMDANMDVYDSDKAWMSETEAEIFHIRYNSENGTTVITINDDKLIAPGTANQYSFTLENTGSTILDYEMSMEAIITGTDYKLPVKARIWDYNDRYLLGSDMLKEDVLNLNNVYDKSQLSAGHIAVYTLEWEWPFEGGNNEFDTLLGNLAVDNDIILTVKIKTYAEYDDTDSLEEDVNDSDNSSDSEPEIRLSSRRNKEKGLPNPSGKQAVFKTGVIMSCVPVVIFTISLIVMLLTGRSGKKDRKE